MLVYQSRWKVSWFDRLSESASSAHSSGFSSRKTVPVCTSRRRSSLQDVQNRTNASWFFWQKVHSKNINDAGKTHYMETVNHFWVLHCIHSSWISKNIYTNMPLSSVYSNANRLFVFFSCLGNLNIHWGKNQHIIVPSFLCQTNKNIQTRIWAWQFCSFGAVKWPSKRL